MCELGRQPGSPSREPAAIQTWSAASDSKSSVEPQWRQKGRFEPCDDSYRTMEWLVLVVGPTGSGKTTTLHSALGFINKPET